MSGLFAGTSLERPVTCEHCGKELDACACPRDSAGQVVRLSAMPVRVRREKRRGKWTTIVAGLDPQATDLKSTLKQLRTSLGTGGGITNDELILQGDHRDQTLSILKSLGYAPKPSGG